MKGTNATLYGCCLAQRGNQPSALGGCGRSSQSPLPYGLT